MNAAKARSDKYATNNTDPTMTDQSGARDTDINLIVKRYGEFGHLPGSARPPQFGDFTGVPQDLAGLIEQARSIEKLRGDLPEQLRTLQVQDLLEMTPQSLAAILTPAKPADQPKEEPK